MLSYVVIEAMQGDEIFYKLSRKAIKERQGAILPEGQPKIVIFYLQKDSTAYSQLSRENRRRIYTHIKESLASSLGVDDSC